MKIHTIGHLGTRKDHRGAAYYHLTPQEISLYLFSNDYFFNRFNSEEERGCNGK